MANVVENSKDWKTTVIGIIALVVPMLTLLGVIDDSTQDTLISSLNMIVNGVAGLIFIFFTKWGK